MIQEILKRKKIIGLVLALVVAFAVYSFFFGGSSGGGNEAVTVETPILSDESVKGRDLLKVLLSLRGIKLDEEIFSSPLFTNLEDFGISLPSSGSVGRVNPFAPLGSDATPPSSGSATTTP